MRQLHFLSAALFLFMSIFCTTVGEAATIYVDKDNPCPGSGTSANPYCSIQNAFDAATPGDTVRIRNAVTPYDQNAILTTSGTATNPIVIEPHLGHTPTIRFTGKSAFAGAIQVKNANHITIRNLNFDGTGVQTSDHAVLIHATTTNVLGITVSGNTFNNWGGTGNNTDGARAVWFAGTNSSGSSVTGTITGNTFTNNAWESIRVSFGSNVVIENNTISSMRCGLFSDGRLGAIAIKDSQDSVGTIIRNNLVDTADTNCTGIPDSGNHLFAGIYCDTGSTDGVIEGNTVHDLNYPHDPTVTESVGIFIESRCHRWKVKRNVVYRIHHKGIRHGSSGTGDPNNAVYENNTFSSIGQRCFHVFRGQNLTIRNNLCKLDSAGIVPIEVSSTAGGQGPHIINYNLWFKSSSSNVGRWRNFTTLNFTNWKSTCGCDADSPTPADPLFTSPTNLTLTSASPARQAGQGGVDLGALQWAGTPPLTSPTKPSQLRVAAD